MLGTYLHTSGVPFAGITHNGQVFSDTDYLLGTLFRTDSTAGTFLWVYLKIFIQGNGFLGTAFHTYSTECTVVVVIHQFSIVIGRLDKDTSPLRPHLVLLVGGTHLRAESTADT
jgi:hypothetical protein